MIDTKGLALLMAFVLQELRKAGYQPEEVSQLFSVENIRLGYELQRKADAGRRSPNPPPNRTRPSGDGSLRWPRPAHPPEQTTT